MKCSGGEFSAVNILFLHFKNNESNCEGATPSLSQRLNRMNTLVNAAHIIEQICLFIFGAANVI